MSAKKNASGGLGDFQFCSMTICTVLVHKRVGAAPCLTPDHEHIVLIEDIAEIQIQEESVLRFEARREQNGPPSITIIPARFFVSPDQSEGHW